MTSLRSGPLLSSQFSHTFSAPKRPLLLPPQSSSSATFKSSPFTSPNSIAPRTQVVEHVALLKARPNADPARVSSMLAALNALSSLDQVLHLTAVPIHRTATSPSPDLASFTHVLHSRHATKRDLKAYHARAAALKEVRRACEEVLAVDWVGVEFNGPTRIEPGMAVRVALLSSREGSHGDARFVRMLKEEMGGFGGPATITSGLNISPARAKGFTAATASGWGGVGEMEAVGESKFLSKAMEFFDVLAVDYVVPSS